jgi:hypothetical protein
VVEYDVLERKKLRKRVREVGSVEAKDIMQWNDLEGGRGLPRSGGALAWQWRRGVSGFGQPGGDGVRVSKRTSAEEGGII